MRRSFRFSFALFVVRTSVLALLAGSPLAFAQSADEMARAATDFLSGLTETQHAVATFDFTDAERHRWNFIPPESYPRGGITLKALDASQRDSARALLLTGLSQRGFMTYSDIVTLERILNALDQGRFARDPEEHYLAVFGNPDAGGTWSFRFEGHHVSLHFTVVEGNISVSTPTFFGANPAVVREGEHQGLRTLGAQEDAGRALMTALSAVQQQQALINAVAPREIVTTNTHPVDPLSPAGISAAEFSEAQLQLLLELITTYSAQMADEIAALRWQKIAADGTGSITFAWAGSVEVGMPHYYRVQSPSFLIEYDNTQNNANHVHSVWRDFADDFGRDLLGEHYADSPTH